MQDKQSTRVGNEVSGAIRLSAAWKIAESKNLDWNRHPIGTS